MQSITPKTPIILVLSPGLDGTGLMFRPLIAALPPHIRPLVLSFPDHTALGYEELLPLVLGRLPADAPFVLLGESFSGPLVLQAAATRPIGLKAVILCASFVTCPRQFVPKWAANLVPASPFRFFPQAPGMKALMAGYANPELTALTKQALSQVAPEVLAHRIRAVIRVDARDELRRCQAPLLYMRGKHDHVVPSANVAAMLRIRPDIQVIGIPAPHMLLETQPDMAALAIDNFISTLCLWN